MARTYSSPASSFFLDKNDLRVSVPDLTTPGKFVCIGDTPNEYTYRALTPLDMPCRTSIKYQDVGDIYSNAKYIDNSARVANKKGIRNSISYTETGSINDDEDATYRKLLTNVATLNLNESVIEELSAAERVAFLKRAFGSFVACLVSDATDAAQFKDFINRQYGSLKPTNFS